MIDKGTRVREERRFDSQGVGFRVQGSGFRVRVRVRVFVWCRGQGSAFRVQGSRFRVCRVQGSV